MQVTKESRDQTVAMLRVKNEERFITRCLTSIFQVCKTIVIFDDGSSDDTEISALQTLYGADYQRIMESNEEVQFEQEIKKPFGWIFSYNDSQDILRVLHFIKSPFTDAVREKERTNEVRDKNFLWAYVKTCIDAKHILAMDGDEMLSKALIRHWQEAINLLENGIDVLAFPFIFLWDGENQRRIDGGYADEQHPRLFTIKRQTEQDLFNQHFAWQGNAGGFHCGSIPRESFSPNGKLANKVFRYPIVHFGYIDDSIRQRKFQFYSRIDPNNKAEGEYLHIIGQRNCHQLGDVKLAQWEDK